MPNKVTRTHNGLMTAMERNAIGKADKQAKQFAKDMAKTPHVRIDWQDEHTVPKVWIDGKPVHGLVDISIDWHTKQDRPHINHFKLKHYQVCAEGEPVLNELRQPEDTL